MRGIVISVLFHGLVALAVALGLPFLHKTPVMPSQTVSVDIVRLSDITKVSKGEKPKPKPQKTPDADRDTAKKPVAKDQAAKPADPKPEKKVETKPETKAASKPKPAPKKQVAEKPVSPKPAETAKPKPAARAETPKQTPKQVEIDPRALKRAEKQPEKKPEKKPDKKPAESARKKVQDPPSHIAARPRLRPQFKPRPKPEAKPDPKPRKQLAEKPKPKPKVKPKAKPTPRKQVAERKVRKKQPRNALDSVFKSVRKMKDRAREESDRDRTAARQPKGQRSATRSQPMTLSEIESVRQQIKPCWNFPAGARNADSLRVMIKLWMNRDGSVRRAQVIDRSRMSSDPYFRAAAEAGRRAVENPRCSPLKLPAEKYDRWKVLIIDFDPSKLRTG